MGTEEIHSLNYTLIGYQNARPNRTGMESNRTGMESRLDRQKKHSDRFLHQIKKRNIDLSVNQRYLALFSTYLSHHLLGDNRNRVAQRLQTDVVTLYEQLVGKIFPEDRRYLLFDCSVATESGDTGIIPLIQYRFR